MSSIGQTLKTVGISPKAVGALLFPVVAALGAATVSWIATGNFDNTEVRTALGGVIAGVVSFIGAYVNAPGQVTPE